MRYALVLKVNTNAFEIENSTNYSDNKPNRNIFERLVSPSPANLKNQPRDY